MPKKTGTKNREVLVSVADGHMNRVADVAHQLRAAGLKVATVSDQLGTITGSVAPSKMLSLKAVEGVAGVEEAQAYQLPSPDSEVQ